MLTRISTTTHEEVYRVTDASSGLDGFIAIHATGAGPAAGGLRMRRYARADDALADVLALSRGMTYKNAAADLPLGGGKAVIMGDPRRDKTTAMLRAMGRAVARLDGRYWIAEDMGMSPEDMAVIRQETGFVAGLIDGLHASGDPSPVTAEGVLRAMRLGARHRFGDPDLTGRRVALQGLGHVGRHLCTLLHDAGAGLCVADPVASNVRWAEADCGTTIVDPAEIHAVEADIFAPCAIGGTVNPETVPALRAGLVAGAANNQLSGEGCADALHGRGILYLPDYVANGGGIINAAAEILRIADRGPWVSARLDALEDTMARILDRAAAEDVSPAHVADRIVEDRMLDRAG